MFSLNFASLQRTDAAYAVDKESSSLDPDPFLQRELSSEAQVNEKVFSLAYQLLQPEELEPHLKECLTEKYKKWQLEKIADSICHTVNEIIINPENSLKAIKKECHELGDKGLYWCILDQENQCVSILIKQTQIGKKTNKSVCKAPCLSFELRPSNKIRRCNTKSFTVLKQTDERKIARILAGRSIQEKIIQSVEGGKFAQLPQFLDKPTKNLLEMYMEWYNDDLKKAMLAEKVPLNFHETDLLPIDMGDAIDVLIDVTRSLSLMHKTGYIHGDLTPSNILIKINAEDKAEGFLNDFDLATKIGFHGTTNANEQKAKNQYFFWDLASNEGWSTTFCDLYGLVMTLASLFVREFSGIENMTLEEQKMTLMKYQNREANFQAHLKDVFGDLLGGISKDYDCSLILDDVLSNPLLADEIIEKVLKSEDLLCEQRKLLAQIKTELLNLKLIIGLIYDACHLNNVFYKQITTNTSLQQTLRSGYEKDKIEVLEGLVKEYDLLTETKVLATLHEIKKNWDSLKEALKDN